MNIFICAVLLSVLPPVVLDTTALQIDEVTVTAPHSDLSPMGAMSSIEKNASFLAAQIQASLALSLSSIAGVQSSSIGSGQSRPAIRGLGFNRISVIHDGVRHEGQQWGEDHGLEIDAFSISHVSVIKGASALLYGSDAIGGVLLLSSASMPKAGIGGRAQLYMRTNNLLFGGYAMAEGRKVLPTGGLSGPATFYWRAGAHYKDYADYHVPTDSFEYYSYRIPLYHRTMRNTAGREVNAAFTIGYSTDRWHTCLRLYENYMRSGFFANAHGLEVRLSDIDYDRSDRDIDLPFQSVNHFKAIVHSTMSRERWSMEINTAWQYNLRNECSEPVSHGYMPLPPDSLARRLDKHTASLYLASHWHVAPKHLLRFGLQSEMQHNRRSGWEFILPDFEQAGLGIYAGEQWSVNPSLNIFAGVRYDFTYLHIHPYQDWYVTSVGEVSEYRTRSKEQERPFHSFTWSAGLQYIHAGWQLKTNIGKAFRVPMAKELGANGINYHIFRYEEGNPDLKPEESYQLDLSVAWADTKWRVQCDPFVGYFPNYIYLNPSFAYREGLQLYTYSQVQVLRSGVELMVTYRPWYYLEVNLQGEYLFARQLSGDKAGYNLPFSPPWRMMPDVKFLWSPLVRQRVWKGYAAIDVRLCGAQYEIVPPEKPTDGWWTLNISAGQQFDIDNCQLQLSLKAENILNAKYYDHTSYYRLIDIPEAGWSISAMLGVTF